MNANPYRPDLQRVVKIILPRNNARDALAAEQMLSTLIDSEPFALELSGLPHERGFQIRGAPAAVTRVIAQIRYTYPQCDFDEVPFDQDIAGLRTNVRRVFELRLRDHAYLPVRTHVSREGRITHDDFGQGADPMLGLLAAMDDLAEGEGCLIQLALKPMPPDWSKYWRGAASDVTERAKFTPSALGGVILLSTGLALFGIGAVLMALVIWLKAWDILSWAAALLGLGALAVFARFRLPSPPDPVFIKQKINSSAFRARIRVFVFARTTASADARASQMLAAFHAYNLAGANGFRAFEVLGDTRAQSLSFNASDGVRGLPFVGFLRRPWSDLPILNTHEVAALWHLPHAAAALQNIPVTTSKRLLPVSPASPSGIFIGTARHQSQSVAVRLSPEMLRGNIGLVARTQSGKSNLMALITSQLMAQDPDAAIIVFDPHRKLAETLAGLVPETRRDQAIFLSLADRDHPFGLNLLDRLPRSTKGLRARSAAERFADKMASDIIGTLEEIWKDNWGPRMENYLRWPLLTLARANEILIADAQFLTWRANTTKTIVELSERLAANRLTPTDEQKLFDDYVAFTQLERPPLGVISRQYDDLKILYERYDNARRGAMIGDATTANDRIPALADLATLLIEESKRGYKRSGISQRVYGPSNRPLQFTLLDVGPLLLHGDFRIKVLGALRPQAFRHIQSWWRDSFETYRYTSPRLLLEMVQPVLSKTDRFLASDIARRIFGQPESTVDIPGIVQEGGILIVDLAAGVVGQDTAALIGSTIINWVASVLFAQQEVRTDAKKRNVYIVIDEFQSVPGVDYAFILSELGKYGARMVMGTQSLRFLDQVNEKARSAWLDNTGTLFVFRCGADDAYELSRELSITDDNPLSITPSDIVGLPDFTCYVRARNGKGGQEVFCVETAKAPDPKPGDFERLWQASLNQCGRDAEAVDQWFALAQDEQGLPDLAKSPSGGHHHNGSDDRTGRVEKIEEEPADPADQIQRESEAETSRHTGSSSEDDLDEMVLPKRGAAS